MQSIDPDQILQLLQRASAMTDNLDDAEFKEAGDYIASAEYELRNAIARRNRRKNFMIKLNVPQSTDVVFINMGDLDNA